MSNVTSSPSAHPSQAGRGELTQSKIKGGRWALCTMR